jgi:hypothetical protein
LPFIVAGTAIGQQLGLISQASSAALVAAGLVSVIIFPAASTALLKKVTPRAQLSTPTQALQEV